MKDNIKEKEKQEEPKKIKINNIPEPDKIINHNKDKNTTQKEQKNEEKNIKNDIKLNIHR